MDLRIIPLLIIENIFVFLQIYSVIFCTLILKDDNETSIFEIFTKNIFIIYVLLVDSCSMFSILHKNQFIKLLSKSFIGILFVNDMLIQDKIKEINVVNNYSKKFNLCLLNSIFFVYFLIKNEKIVEKDLTNVNKLNTNIRSISSLLKEIVILNIFVMSRELISSHICCNDYDYFCFITMINNMIRSFRYGIYIFYYLLCVAVNFLNYAYGYINIFNRETINETINEIIIKNETMLENPKIDLSSDLNLFTFNFSNSLPYEILLKYSSCLLFVISILVIYDPNKTVKVKRNNTDKIIEIGKKDSTIQYINCNLLILFNFVAQLYNKYNKSSNFEIVSTVLGILIYVVSCMMCLIYFIKEQSKSLFYLIMIMTKMLIIIFITYLSIN